MRKRAIVKVDCTPSLQGSASWIEAVSRPKRVTQYASVMVIAFDELSLTYLRGPSQLCVRLDHADKDGATRIRRP